MTDDSMTDAAARGSEAPLYALSYELTGQLVEDSAGALAGSYLRNPAGYACVLVLVAIVLIAWVRPGDGSTPLLVALVLAWLGLYQLATKWQRVQVRRLRRAGLDCALVAAGERRREVRVYDDRVEVWPKPRSERVGRPKAGRDGAQGTPDAEQAAGGARPIETHRLSQLRRIATTSELAVLAFADGGLVPIPQRAMSAQRYQDLLERLGGGSSAGRPSSGR